MGGFIEFILHSIHGGAFGYKEPAALRAGGDDTGYGNGTYRTSNKIELADYAGLGMQYEILKMYGDYYNSSIELMSITDSDAPVYADGVAHGSVTYLGTGKISGRSVPNPAKGVNTNTYYDRLLDVKGTTIRNVLFNANSGAMPSNTVDARLYTCFLVKQDDYVGLLNLANLDPSEYSSEKAICQSAEAIDKILNSEKAIEYMIYNCTGTFMITFIANTDCLTKLNSSQYKTMVYANEHWNKFLAMVVA